MSQTQPQVCRFGDWTQARAKQKAKLLSGHCCSCCVRDWSRTGVELEAGDNLCAAEEVRRLGLVRSVFLEVDRRRGSPRRWNSRHWSRRHR
jgi:hypothetical protein